MAYRPCLRILLLAFLLHVPWVARGGSIQVGGPCTQANTHLNPSNQQLTGDCDSTAYCAVNGTCLAKGCRRDEYPYGYSDTATLPPRCPFGQFCPDEEDACYPWLPVGSQCQLNRDDECEPPPNAHDLAGSRNVNGSVCLNFECLWANVTAGEPCEVENTVYTGYYANGDIFYDIVSRDNCIKGTYCDGVARLCINNVDEGGTCSADKECDSYNCLLTGVCGALPDSPSVVHPWVYAIVALGIALCMLGVWTSLVFIHRRNRTRERQRRMEYWNEQENHRRTLAQIRETIAPQSGGLASSRSLASSPTTSRQQETGSNDKHNSFGYTAVGSSLRNAYQDEDEGDGSGESGEMNLVDNSPENEESRGKRRRKSRR